MSKLTTNAQQHEIEAIANDGHADALIAYGADMYRDGLVDGSKYGFRDGYKCAIRSTGMILSLIVIACVDGIALARLLKNKFSKREES